MALIPGNKKPEWREIDLVTAFENHEQALHDKEQKLKQFDETLSCTNSWLDKSRKTIRWRNKIIFLLIVMIIIITGVRMF